MDNLILLCSGNLGEICLKHISLKNPPKFVFTDKGSASIIDFCKTNGITFYAGNPRTETASAVIASLNCSILLSVNYLFIVESNLLAVACDYAINFHGSLLPKYRGRTPHVWAIINGEKETGVTAHLMAGEVDNGQIIRQVVLPIDDDDTGYTVLKKFYRIYPSLIDEVLEDIETGKVALRIQEHEKATYFGKRTPDDGEICWHWQKERICNWIRAQAHPYPGAFSYCDQHKIIIHKIEFDDTGYHFNDPDGLILKEGAHPVIKTPNGAVKLLKFEVSNSGILEKGKILCRKSL